MIMCGPKVMRATRLSFSPFLTLYMYNIKYFTYDDVTVQHLYNDDVILCLSWMVHIHVVTIHHNSLNRRFLNHFYLIRYIARPGRRNLIFLVMRL